MAIVENDRLRLVFGTTPVPYLRELVQKPSQTNLLLEPAEQNLFALVIARAKAGRLEVESGSAKEGAINVVRVGQSQRIGIQFTGLGPARDLRVELTGVLDDDSPFVRWSIKVDNPGGEALSAVRFPYVTAAPAIGAPADDFIVAPALPGAMIENPARSWPVNYSVTWAFPGAQSAQFCSLQDLTAGVYIASMDTGGHGRALRIGKRSDRSFLLYQEYITPEEPATQWASPYEVALGVTSGTWQQTADIYKRWAVHQPWCARTIAQREDIPALWKQGPSVHICSVRSAVGDRYSTLVKHLREFRQSIDCPVVSMLAGWEKHGTWIAGDYFPVFGGERAADAFTQLRDDGLLPLFYFSGLNYTFKTEGTIRLSVSGATNYIESFVIDKETGKPKEAILRTRGMKRISYEFCPAAKGTKEYFYSLIDQAHAIGVDVIQMDQTPDGAGSPCYSVKHDHQRGTGPYQFQAFRELLADLRRHGRSLSREFALLHEEVHEELIPYVDCFHTRECREGWWYRKNLGARGIPLFSYLYHEYALAYSAGAVPVKDPSPFTVRQHAVNLITGRLSSVADWGDQQAMTNIHPDQLRMLRNHAHLLKTPAQRFLILGRMLHSLELNVRSVTYEIEVTREKVHAREAFVESAVLTSSWQSPEGNVGHCLVNTTATLQRIRLSLDTRNAPEWPKADIDLYRADRPQICEHVLQDVSLPREYMLELAPLEAVFFVIRPAKI